jgi:Tfp pilus assembly protein PilP
MSAPVRTLVLLATAALSVAVALAQTPPAAPTTTTPASPAQAVPGTTAGTTAPGDAAPVERPPLDAEMDTGGYTYNSQGRRDPFISLQRPVAADRGPKTRKPGMEGFLIQEVALKGIVKTRGGGLGSARQAGYIAILLGADGKSYFVSTGQRLYDGVIVGVDASSVTFRQEVTDPLSPVKTREVRKSLNALEEARQ